MKIRWFLVFGLVFFSFIPVFAGTYYASFSFDGTNTTVDLTFTLPTEIETTGRYTIEMIVELTFLDDDFNDIHDIIVELELGNYEDYFWAFDDHLDDGDCRMYEIGETRRINETFSYNALWGECAIKARLHITEEKYMNDPNRKSEWVNICVINEPETTPKSSENKTTETFFPILASVIGLVTIQRKKK